MRRLRKIEAPTLFAELLSAGNTENEAIDIIARSWKIGRDTIRKMVIAADSFEVTEKPLELPSGSPRQIWALLEGYAADRREEAKSTGKATISINSPDKIAVAFIIDNHIGGELTDYRKMREDAELVAKTDGLYVILGGDLVDNFILSKMANAARGQSVGDIKMQYELVNEYLSWFNGKILAIVAGNHDLWTPLVAGVDVLGDLAASNGILYDQHEFQVKLLLNQAEYNVLIRHQSRFNSTMNLTHSCKQLLRMGGYSTPPDIVVMGHHHEPAIEYFMWGEKDRIAMRTGSYKAQGDYERSHAFSGGGYMVPSVILDPNTREMVAIPHLGSVGTILDNLRK